MFVTAVSTAEDCTELSMQVTAIQIMLCVSVCVRMGFAVGSHYTGGTEIRT